MDTMPLARKRIRLAVAACCLSMAATGVQANPGGATVVSGSAVISQSGNTLTVANSPNAIINWHDFSIGSGEVTRFIQQSASSAVLNRVTGGNASQILGTLQSNGRVFLINPAGVMFGSGAVVDVAGLVASTLNISDADFLSGKHNYNASVAQPGKVGNAGEISTPSGGFVYLIGAQVENSGVINTPSGEAILAAGHHVELVDSANPDQRVLVSAQSQDVNLSQLMLQNDGNIFAVLNSGRVSANTVTQDETGKIYFKSAGSITTVAGSVTEAKGTSTLDGGKIVSFATGDGIYAGTLDVSGRNGGFVETSGSVIDLHLLDLHIGALGSGGSGGTWLIDPYDVELVTGSGGSISASGGGTTSQVGVDLINTALSSGGNVLIDTVGDGSGTGNGDITVKTSFDYNSYPAAGTLQLDANRSIIFDPGVQITDSSGSTLSLTMTARGGSISFGTGSGVDIGGDAIFGATGNITTNGGVIAAGTVTLSSDLNITAKVNTPSISAFADNGGTISITEIGALDQAFLQSTTGGRAATIAGPVTLALTTAPTRGANIDLYGTTSTLNATTGMVFDSMDIRAHGNTLDINVNGALTVDAGNIYGTGTATDVNISAGAVTLQNFHELTSTADISITTPGALVFSTGEYVQADGNFSLSAGSLAMDGSSSIESRANGGTDTIAAGAISLDSNSSISSDAALNLTASSLALADSSIDIENAASINVSGAMTLDRSDINGGQTSGDTVIQAGSLNVTGLVSAASNIVGYQGLDITVSGATVLGTRGNLWGASSTNSGFLSLDTGSLIMTSSSQLQSYRALTVNVNGDASLTGATLLGNLSLISGLSTTISVGGNLALDNTSITTTKDLSVGTGGQLSLQNNALLEATGGSALISAGSLSMHDADITAATGLTLSTGAAVLTDATIDTNGNLDFTNAGLNMTRSKVGDASGMTPSITTINSSGDILLKDGSEIVADNEVFITLLGQLYLSSGASGRSLIGTYSNNTIYLYFPGLFAGGYFMDGSESLLVSAFNPLTGFFTGTSLTNTAILNNNLFISYAPSGPVTGIISQNTTNTLATNPYVDSYGPQQTGPGDSSYTYGIYWDPVLGGLNFSEVRECS